MHVIVYQYFLLLITPKQKLFGMQDKNGTESSAADAFCNGDGGDSGGEMFKHVLQANSSGSFGTVILQDLHCLQISYHNIDRWGIYHTKFRI